MSGIKLQKREYDFFVSYRHADLRRVAIIVEWLTKLCGLKIWFDDDQGNAAKRTTELLGAAIGNARGALFFLSETWKQSPICKDEFEVALEQRYENAGFEVVAVRIDDAEPPSWFKIGEIIDLRTTDRRATARLLRSLSSDVPHLFDNTEDVYLAAPWSRPSPLATDTFAALRLEGWRLIGDPPTFKHQEKSRIQSIMRTTRGVVALLPRDERDPHGTSPFILKEAEWALECGKPLLLLMEPGITPPDDLVKRAFRGQPVKLVSDPGGKAALVATFGDFDEHLASQPHDDTGAFIFFAASLRDNSDEADDIASVVERASNMRCVRGERLSADNVQQAIIDRIRRATVVIADTTDDHRNTLIETGIAMGCGTKLRLMAHAPDGIPGKKPFMFEGQEFFGYRTPEERLCLSYFFARQFRRHVYVVR